MSRSPTAIAALDIGTNTTLLLLARAAEQPGAEPIVLTERAEVTGLGRGIGGDGLLRAENIARTLTVLAEYAALARAQHARIVAVGTEALRRAPNAELFLSPARAILGIPVEVIGGDREADLTFAATRNAFPELMAGTTLTIDIGGGSTEFIRSESGKVTFRRSLPLGSVRLHERFLAEDPPANESCAALVLEVQRALDAIPSKVDHLIGTAGTVTTLAAMALKLSDYDPARVHGYRLSLAELQRQTARLKTASLAERQAIPGLDPRRADVILAGALLCETIAAYVGAETIVVSDRGVRWGLLYEALG